ncbi:MAG: putative glycosyl transferase [Actinomycetia bacterium]|nr:putative glycosyl transferase [Actinomycetes bacterium]
MTHEAPRTEQREAGDWPSLSVVIPVRNDAAHLAGAVAAVLAQDYPRPFEVVLGVGPSDDGTEEVAATLAQHEPRVRVVANPEGGTAAGLNVAIAASSGDVVARVDGHCELSPGYLRRAVETLRATGADNVGGVQEAIGSTPFERAVAAAMTSRFGVGNARFHYGGDAGPTDTVYLGVFSRDALRRVGGFDEDLVRNQDYELNWRLRDSGGTVWFDPELRVKYRPRPSLAGLARQYFEYGQWKREMLRRHPRSLRWRQAVPPVALVGNAVGVVVGLLFDRRALAVPAIYAAATLAASATAGSGEDRAVAARLPLVFVTMHNAWGAGFIVGPKRPRRSRPLPGR